MRMVDLILKKRNGIELSKDEIDFMIRQYTQGNIPDYQMSAWAMAVYFQGMTKEETAHLTMAMVNSGEVLNLSSIKGIKVDKHSTGGVGDTTTIVLAPLVASCGVPVAKMSGRGLGHTGGTIDKLESFTGFSVEIDNTAFAKQVNEQNIAVISQTGNLTPADKMLYALRDVTATVDTVPLIASSIMSKKIAAGADAIVLDVKTGSGAFMKHVEQAEELAQAMVDIGKQIGKRTVAVISDMNQPLGRAVGNALEVREAIDTLIGQGPEDLYELCLTLGSQMLVLAERTADPAEAREILRNQIHSGAAFDKLCELVEAQGGDTRQVRSPERLPQAANQLQVKAKQSGYVSAIETEEVGTVAMLVGAGRAMKNASIDLAVGVYLNKKIGDYVQEGESLATLHYQQHVDNHLVERLRQAFTLSKDKPQAPSLIYKMIT